MTYHIRKPPQLTPRHALEHHAHAGGPVARADGQAVDGAQHAHHAVAGHVEHGGGDDAVGLGEAVCLAGLASYEGGRTMRI